MYDVLTISRFIINYSNEKKYSISNLRLQKLLYFVQATFLLETNKPCFKEKIIAWDFGPVVIEAYNEFKTSGCLSISTVKTYNEDDKTLNWWENIKTKTFDDSIIKLEHKTIIKNIIDSLSMYSTQYLTKITHNQQPWKETYTPNANSEIKTENIKTYFKQQENNKKGEEQ